MSKFDEGVGCTYCNMTGYRGRVGIYELLEIDAPLADAIRRDDLSELRAARRTAAGIRAARRARARATPSTRVTSVDEVMRGSSGARGARARRGACSMTC